VTGFVLAMLGAARSPDRKVFVALLMVGVTLVLAFGRHTPLYRPMFDHLPLYGSFRATAKFAFVVTLWLAWLAARGFDGLMDRPRINWWMISVVLALSIGMTLLAISIRSSNSSEQGWWRQAVQSIWASAKQGGDQYTFGEKDLQTDAFWQRVTGDATHAAFVSAGLLLAIAALLAIGRTRSRVLLALPVLAVVELGVVAWQSTADMDADQVSQVPDRWKTSLARLNPSDRVVVTEMDWMSFAMKYRLQSAWGYDPQILKRYAEVMFLSQQFKPSEASQYLFWRMPSRAIFAMCRIRFVLLPTEKPATVEMPPGLAVAQLINKFEVLPRAEDRYARLVDPTWNPFQTVILEESPGIQPSETSGGSANVTASGNDWLDIEVSTPAPTILLVTNNFSKSWTVRPTEPGAQDDYRIIPANHTLQAIPLVAGKHFLHLEYRPQAFVLGCWISAVSWAGCAGLIGWLLHARTRRPKLRRSPV
jgi:hypothetical protein